MPKMLVARTAFSICMAVGGVAFAARPALSAVLATSLSAWDAGVGSSTVYGTPVTGLLTDPEALNLPIVTAIPLTGGAGLTLSNNAEVTNDAGGTFSAFPFAFADGFTGDLFIPEDANGNNVMSETITVSAGVTALGFEVAPYGSATANFNGTGGGPYSVTLALANGGSDTLSLAGGSFDTGTTQSQFFGYYGGGVTSLTISTSDPTGLAFGNFVDAQTAVPEPASATILLVGVAGLLLLSRSRARPA